ncbi:MAG TPA: HAD family hydrolase [Nitrospirae bacterium]|nr:HAD family hydrolase [Nitrospirota bacterium]
MKEILLLFDIDGTLIDSGEAGSRALDRAFEELFGIRNAFRSIQMAGKTDTQIIKEALGFHGIGNGMHQIKRFVSRYVELLKVEIENPRRRLKPGVAWILEYFNSMGLPMGLLTGNIEEGARIKLGPFGINHYFPAGAFGSDHEDRDKLLPIAVERFSRLGIDLPPERCIIIGDTPRDVRCAKVHGARAVAVSTGPYDTDTLMATDADLVVETLEDRKKIVEFLKSL